jgi:hypothetical protein
MNQSPIDLFSIPVGLPSASPFGLKRNIGTDVAIYWGIAPCSPYVNDRFGGTYHLHLQGRKSAQQETSVQQVTGWFLVRLIFDPEDLGDMFLRNVCSHTDYTALYPIKWQHS